jgi:hypothetical protein
VGLEDGFCVHETDVVPPRLFRLLYVPGLVTLIVRAPVVPLIVTPEPVEMEAPAGAACAATTEAARMHSAAAVAASLVIALIALLRSLPYLILKLPVALDEPPLQLALRDHQ